MSLVLYVEFNELLCVTRVAGHRTPLVLTHVLVHTRVAEHKTVNKTRLEDISTGWQKYILI